MSNQQGWTQNDSFDNWDDVSSEAPKPLDPGIYNATIVKAEAAQTGKGKPAVKLEVSATGVFQGDELPTPRKLYDTKPITFEAQGLVKNLCQAAGVEPPKGNGYEVVSAFADELVGLSVIVKVKLESYVKDGEKRTVARIDRYFTGDQAERAKNPEAVAAPAGEAAAPTGGRRRRGASA